MRIKCLLITLLAFSTLNAFAANDTFEIRVQEYERSGESSKLLVVTCETGDPHGPRNAALTMSCSYEGGNYHDMTQVGSLYFGSNEYEFGNARDNIAPEYKLDGRFRSRGSEHIFEVKPDLYFTNWVTYSPVLFQCRNFDITSANANCRVFTE